MHYGESHSDDISVIASWLYTCALRVSFLLFLHTAR